MEQRAELFPHGADIGVRGRGATLEEAFAAAARALTSVVTDPQQVREVMTVEVHCEAPDRELLLMQWLNEVVFEMATRHAVFARFEVHIGQDGRGWHLSARLHGEPVDAVRHGPAVEPKGATFTALEVGEREGRWHAQCVVDV